MIVSGDIFDGSEKYLCHQCNCITTRAAHFAKDVFDRFPYADVYAGRVNPDEPGQIIIRGDGGLQRNVVALLGQYYPGKSRYESALDGRKARERYFYRCLLRLAKIDNLESVAFPWRIGCGAAGGDWETYLKMIQTFARYVKVCQNATVTIYKRDD